MPSSAKQKRHTKNTGGKKVQYNELFYYHLFGQTICKIPTSDIKYKKAFDNFTV